MEIMSKRDVMVSRGIWYMMTLVSLLALAISINLLWPFGDNCESSKSRFFRDCAVSAITFYAVMLLRYFVFADLLSQPFREFIASVDRELPASIKRIPQFLISLLAFYVVICSPLKYKEYMQEYVVSVSLFTVSLVTGGIGLIQLSDKLRMETRHTLITLFFVWLFCLSGIYLCSSYDQKALGIGMLCELAATFLILLFLDD
ncbi:hypothetical protein Rs2_25219 [Raphanus sativus]|nr:hypothetical protein Rs2_25219 [Raphanus sativus]